MDTDGSTRCGMEVLAFTSGDGLEGKPINPGRMTIEGCSLCGVSISYIDDKWPSGPIESY